MNPTCEPGRDLSLFAGRKGISRPQKYVAIAVVLTVGVASLAVIFSFSPQRSSPVTTSQSASSHTSISETTSSDSRSRILFSWGSTPRVMGPGTTINYTLTLIPFYLSGHFSLSYIAPNGISIVFNPSTAELAGSGQAVDAKVHAAESIRPGDYPVTVLARGVSGSFNLTFQFHVFDHLIIIPQSSALPSGFVPENLTTNVGSTVTWISLDGGTDDFAGIHEVNFATLNVHSTLLHAFDTWSYTFTQSGTFVYDDPNFPQNMGTIVVLPQK